MLLYIFSDINCFQYGLLDFWQTGSSIANILFTYQCRKTAMVLWLHLGLIGLQWLGGPICYLKILVSMKTPRGAIK